MRNKVIFEFNIENLENNFVETRNISIAYIESRA